MRQTGMNCSAFALYYQNETTFFPVDSERRRVFLQPNTAGHRQAVRGDSQTGDCGRRLVSPGGFVILVGETKKARVVCRHCLLPCVAKMYCIR